MAGLTSYGAHNIIVLKDYNFVFNEVVAGQPTLYIKIHVAKDDPSEQTDDTVEISNWYKGTCEESARWKYVGMNYATAKACATAMRNMLNNPSPVWEYGPHMENGDLVVGWYVGATTPQLESDVQIQKTGSGSLYDVVISAKMTQEQYSATPGTNITGSRPLRDLLPYVAGFYDSANPKGKYYTSAGSDNIDIVSGPTVHREFQLLGADITTVIPNDQSLTGYTFPLWYKEKRTYQCEVKFVGMTRQACANLFNALNSSSGGLWHQFQQYEYKFVATQGQRYGGTFDWVGTGTNVYQNLNEFDAHPVGANLWEVYVKLTQWQEYYTKTPNASFTPSWPTEWNNVPGLSSYL